MGIFHVFEIALLVPNRVTHHISSLLPSLYFIQFAIISSIAFLSFVVISVIYSVLYIIFLLNRVFDTPMLWLTYIHPVSGNFSTWHCLAHCSCSIIAIRLLKLLFNSNCLSCLFFCNFNSFCTYLFFCQVLDYFFFLWGFFAVVIW